jgi:hypothetical protein
MEAFNYKLVSKKRIESEDLEGAILLMVSELLEHSFESSEEDDFRGRARHAVRIIMKKILPKHIAKYDMIFIKEELRTRYHTLEKLKIAGKVPEPGDGPLLWLKLENFCDEVSIQTQTLEVIKQEKLCKTSLEDCLTALLVFEALHKTLLKAFLEFNNMSDFRSFCCSRYVLSSI